MEMTCNELEKYQAELATRKAFIQKQFDDEEWEFFGDTPLKIQYKVDAYIAQGLLEVPPGRALTKAQSKSRSEHLQLQFAVQQLIEERLKESGQVLPNTYAASSATSTTSVPETTASTTGKDVGHLRNIHCPSTVQIHHQDSKDPDFHASSS